MPLSPTHTSGAPFQEPLRAELLVAPRREFRLGSDVDTPSAHSWVRKRYRGGEREASSDVERMRALLAKVFASESLADADYAEVTRLLAQPAVRQAVAQILSKPRAAAGSGGGVGGGGGGAGGLDIASRGTSANGLGTVSGASGGGGGGSSSAARGANGGASSLCLGAGSFASLSRILNVLLDTCAAAQPKDLLTPTAVVQACSVFYREDGQSRTYVDSAIKAHPFWRNMEYWKVASRGSGVANREAERSRVCVRSTRCMWHWWSTWMSSAPR
jgi:hypothetical protein